MMPRARHLVAAFLGLALPLAAGAQEAPRAPQVPDLKVEKYTLPNGLEVILHEDHTIPTVAVNLWYKVGSKDEKVGRTGFAHLFEHLMFQGSQHHDSEYFGPLEKVGADLNGSTNEDRTNYYESLPANGLERALWLEADRMGFLLPALTQEKLDNQREVVKNERRQRVDNQPYGMAMEALLEALYPEDHPYHHSVIGSMADLSAASLGDVQNFFRTYYVPNNASLVIAGDFDPAEAKKLVAKYFGSIPKGPEVPRVAPAPPVLEAAKHITMTDRVAQPRIELVWHTVPAGNPDEPALDILAEVLGGLDKENRLYRALQYDKPLATNVSAGHPTHRLAGTFEVTLSARPGQDLDELVALADKEIKRLQDEGPTPAEVAKAQNARESSLVFRLQSASAKADFLNSSNVLYGDPLGYKDEIRRVFAVTPADVQRVAKQYLSGKRVRLDVTPGAQAQRPPEAEVDRKAQVAIAPEPPPVKDDFDRTKMPELAATPEFTPPAPTRRKLSNGLDVLIAERHDLPIVTLNLLVRGGQLLEPAGKEGVADLTAQLLSEGTKELDTFELAGALAEIGASLNAGFSRESGDLSLTTLTKHTDRALALFADVLLNPAFPPEALERLRKEKLVALQRRQDNPQAVAGVVFPKTLYGATHPYGRIDSPASVAAITRDDVLSFFGGQFVPANATLIVVGDVKPDEIVARLEKALAGWKGGPAPKRPELAAVPARPVQVYLVDKPGSAQSILYAGQIGVPRSTPDYFPIEVMNAILGGQFSSRINLNLREEKGYTYGARSSFVFRQGPGPFVAATSVQTAVTKEALAELIKELRDITGPRPVTATELEFARENLVRGFPSQFGTTFGLAGQLEEIALYDLPADYFTSYQAKLNAVTVEEVNRVAKKYLDPDHLTIVVVGDRAKIEPGLKTLPFAGTIQYLDAEGNPAEQQKEAAASR